MAASIIPDARVVLIERNGRWWLEVFIEYWTLYRREISLDDVKEMVRLQHESYDEHIRVLRLDTAFRPNG